MHFILIIHQHFQINYCYTISITDLLFRNVLLTLQPSSGTTINCYGFMVNYNEFLYNLKTRINRNYCTFHVTITIVITEVYTTMFEVTFQHWVKRAKLFCKVNFSCKNTSLHIIPDLHHTVKQHHMGAVHVLMVNKLKHNNYKRTGYEYNVTCEFCRHAYIHTSIFVYIHVFTKVCY